MALSSLPTPYGVGDLGPSAYRWIDHLSQMNQTVWQMLPVGLFDKHACPYASPSAFGGNPLFISIDLLHEQGLITKDELKSAYCPESDVFDYTLVLKKKIPVLIKAAKAYMSSGAPLDQLIVEDSEYWLPSFVEYFCQQKNEELEDREFAKHAQLFWQYCFDQQWTQLKEYAKKKNVKLFGDLPIFVGKEGLDTHSFSECFKLDQDKQPQVVTGAPPDYFSPKGQVWNTPNYNWDYLAETKFEWWTERMRYHQKLFDLIRIDHFIGLVNVWEVPYGAKDAIGGQWVKSRGRELLEAIDKNCPDIHLVAEDLGELSDQVHRLRDDYKLASMRVFQFAFGDDDDQNIHLPKNVSKHCVYYTGTHDNQTLKQWLDSLTDIEQRRLQERKIEATTKGVLQAFYQTVAEMVITPTQDILELGEKARMNVPGTLEKNWQWRMSEQEYNNPNWEYIKELTSQTKRSL